MKNMNKVGILPLLVMALLTVSGVTRAQVKNIVLAVVIGYCLLSSRCAETPRLVWRLWL